MSGVGGGGREMNLWRLDQSHTPERLAGNVSVQVCECVCVGGGMCVFFFCFTVQWLGGSAESGGASPSGGGQVSARAGQSFTSSLQGEMICN